MAVPKRPLARWVDPCSGLPSVNGRPQSRRVAAAAQFVSQGDPMAPAAASISTGVGVRDTGEGGARDATVGERAVSSGASRSRAVTTDSPAGAPAPRKATATGQRYPERGKLTPRQAMERLLSSNPRPTMAVAPAPEVQGNQDGSLRADPPPKPRRGRVELKRIAPPSPLLQHGPGRTRVQHGNRAQPSGRHRSSPNERGTESSSRPRPTASAEPGAGASCRTLIGSRRAQFLQPPRSPGTSTAPGPEHPVPTARMGRTDRPAAGLGADR